MAEKVKLSNGETLTVDINKLNVLEFRELLAPETSEDRSDELLGKMTGKTKDEIQTQFGFLDYRLLSRSFSNQLRELNRGDSDPNLESKSTDTSDTRKK